MPKTAAFEENCDAYDKWFERNPAAKEVVDHLERAGFGIDGIRQTLVPEKPPETILDGFGKGSFLVIKGMKDSPTREREGTSP